MIRINLLPESERVKPGGSPGRNMAILFIVFVAALLGGLLWYHGNLSGKIDNLNARIDYTRKELDRYNKIVKRVEEIRSQLAVLKQKLGVIETLSASRGGTFRLMFSMTEMVIKDRMWLTNFEAVERVTVVTKGQGKSQTREEVVETNIAIQGVALDEKTVADFMTRLENARVEMEEQDLKLFTNVRLVTLQHENLRRGKAQEEIPLKRFQVTCQKNPPLKPEAEEAKKS